MKLTAPLVYIQIIVLYTYFVLVPGNAGAVNPSVWFDGVSIQPVSEEQKQVRVNGLILQIDQDLQEQIERHLHKERLTFQKLTLKGFYFLPNPEGETVWDLSMRLRVVPGIKAIEPNQAAPIAPR